MMSSSVSFPRNQPGAKVEDCNNWHFNSIHDSKSTLYVRDYLQFMVRNYRDDIDILLQVPEGIKAQIWVYEHIRQITIELGGLVVKLSEECSERTCP
ncbi:MOB member 4, phocein, partial [Spiromyces aspiralis]